MHQILFLDLFSGASGDMLLGALLDAGLALDDLKAELGKLALSGYELEAERQVRHGLGQSGDALLHTSSSNVNDFYSSQEQHSRVE